MKQHFRALLCLCASVLIWFQCLVFGQTSDIRTQLVYQSQSSKTYISAHRGGRNILGHPENAIETFNYTLAKVPQSIIELDVNITSDGVLFLMHDESLDRTTTGTGKVKEQPWSYIEQLYLVDDYGARTHYRPPSLEAVLQWAGRGQTFIMVDVKRGVPFQEVIRLLNRYKMEHYAAIITYSIADAVEVHRLDPDYMISLSIRNQEEWQQACNTDIPYNRMIAFTGTLITNPSLYDALHDKNVMCILGTLGNLDRRAAAKGGHVYCDFIRQGADILATDRPNECANALQQCTQKAVSRD